MKKPFNETKVGKFLTEKKAGKIITGAVDTFTGGLASNVIEKTQTTTSGQVDYYKLLGLIIAGAALIGVLTGKLTPEQAQDFVTP